MLREGLKKEPYYSPGLCTLVAVLVDLDRNKEAAEPLSTLKEIVGNPDLAKMQTGQGDNGEINLQKRVEGIYKFLSHRGKPGYNQVSHISAKESSLKHENWKIAEECSELALILKPDNLDTLRFHAMTLWRQNKLGT